MTDLGFLWAYAVVEVRGFDPDAAVQPETSADPRYRSTCLKVFWAEADAAAEAKRLNAAFGSRPIHHLPIHHLVERTMVEIRPGDPQFDGVTRGAAYIARQDDEEMNPGDRRYQCHWEYEGPIVVWTGGFDSIDDALEWARLRAPSVTVQLNHSEHYEAGSSNTSDLPPWPPPPDWNET